MRKPLTLASLAVASIAITPMLGVGTAFAADGDTMANLVPSPSTASTGQRHRHGGGQRQPRST